MPASLDRRLRALGAAPTTEAVFRAFAAWCAEEAGPDGTSDRVWLALGHLLTDAGPAAPWPCEVRLVREREAADGGLDAAGVVLRFPLTAALRARLDDPHADTSWVEGPRTADRLWARFRSAVGPLLAPYVPRVRGLDDPDED